MRASNMIQAALDAARVAEMRNIGEAVTLLLDLDAAVGGRELDPAERDAVRIALERLESEVHAIAPAWDDER